jgi:hypothetical protein
MIILGIIVYFRPLFLGETFYYRDLYLHFLPQKRLLVDLIHSGQLPLWDRFLHGGQPLLADPNNVCFYPTSFLYLILPLFTAFSLDIVLHFLFASLAAYALARAVGLGRAGATLAGVIYAYAGPSLSMGNLLYRMLALPYVPLLLLFWHRYLSEGRKKWMVWAIAAGAAQFLAGAPENSLMTAIALLAWALCVPDASVSIRERLGKFVLLWTCIAGLCAVLWIPAVEMIAHSSRGRGLGFERASTWSIHPNSLPELVFPSFMGKTDTLSEDGYWGQSIVDRNFPYVLSLYFGWMALGLAALGGMLRRGGTTLPAQARRVMLGLSILAGLLALGRFLPGYYWIYKAVPILHLFRYPVKFLLAVTLPVALLAGIGLERLFSNPEGRSGILRRARFCLGFLAGLLATAGGALWLFPSFCDTIQRFFFSKARPGIAHGLQASLLHAIVILGLGAAWLLFSRRVKPSLRPWGLVALVAMDLLWAGGGINPTAPREAFLEVPPAAAEVSLKIGDGRLYRAENPPGILLTAPGNDYLYQVLWNLSTLYDYTGALYRIPVIYHTDFDGLANERIMFLQQAIGGLPWNKRLPLLSASGVRLILCAEKIDVPGVTLIREIPNSSNMRFFLYKNEKMVSHVAFFREAVAVTSDREALERMMAPGFDPRAHVLIQGGTGLLPAPGAVSAHIRLLWMKSCASAYRVTTAQEGYLYFCEPYYPGWHVYVDGKEVPIQRANIGFSAVHLGPGTHAVERKYRPISFRFGWAVTLITMLGVGVAFLWRFPGPTRTAARTTARTIRP